MRIKKYLTLICALLLTQAVLIGSPYRLTLTVIENGKERPPQIETLTKGGKFSVSATAPISPLQPATADLFVGNRINGELTPLNNGKVHCFIRLSMNQIVASLANREAWHLVTHTYIIDTPVAPDTPTTFELGNNKLVLTINEADPPGSTVAK